MNLPISAAIAPHADFAYDLYFVKFPFIDTAAPDKILIQDNTC